MLIASNLGQMLGRLMYGDEGSLLAAPQPKRLWRGGRRAQIIELERRGSVACCDLVNELGITGGNATVTLLHMYEAGELVRTGKERAYRYSLPAAEGRKTWVGESTPLVPPAPGCMLR